jgi:hypothetical protein
VDGTASGLHQLEGFGISVVEIFGTATAVKGRPHFLVSQYISL